MSDEGISIKLEINADEAIGAIGNLLGYINSGELMQDIGNQVADYSRKRILSKENTAPDGSRWPSLAESTLLRKRKLGVEGKGILVSGAKSGRASLVDTIMAANAGRIRQNGQL